MDSKYFDLSQLLFSRKSDVVNPGETIFNPEWSTVRTFKGEDQIIGSASVNFNLAASVGVAAEAIGEGSNPAASAEFTTQARLNIDGIINRGNILTGRGEDIISGTAAAQVTAIAQTVSEAIAIANTVDANAISTSLAAIDIAAIANGINNSGRIFTGAGDDTVSGTVEAGVAAVATATIDVTAIVSAIAQAPMSEGLQAVAAGFATSLASSRVLATGLNNEHGLLSTGTGADGISAVATSYSATYAEAQVFAVATAPPENQALALAVVEAIALTEDLAIAIDNEYGYINTGYGADKIEATANASDNAIGIYNQYGNIRTGYGADIINVSATGSLSFGIYSGTVNTGYGADTIEVHATGSQSYGIYGSYINTGYGDDTIEVDATSYDIYGSKIDTGYGDDTVKADNFGGGVYITMGDGNDYIEGFGEATVYGGEDFDILSFGSYNRSDFDIQMNHDYTEFKLGGTIMRTSEFEQYSFADGDYSFDNLIA